MLRGRNEFREKTGFKMILGGGFRRQQLLGTPGVTLGLIPDSGRAGRELIFGTLFEFLAAELGRVAVPPLPVTDPAEPTLAPHGTRGPVFPVVAMLGALMGAMIVLWPTGLPPGTVGAVGTEIVPLFCADANDVAMSRNVAATFSFFRATVALMNN